jgi:DinB superfamily
MANPQNTLKKFKEVFTYWHTELDKYSEEHLSAKPDTESWSMGQVYNHLIFSALYFHLKEVETCLNSSENKNESKNFKGFLGFVLLNGFPPIKIKVPASDQYTPSHPESKSEIKDNLDKVKVVMQDVLQKFQSDLLGKTVHPGFSFLNAAEWYRMIEMHWRHHKRQKETLDKILNV